MVWVDLSQIPNGEDTSGGLRESEVLVWDGAQQCDVWLALPSQLTVQDLYIRHSSSRLCQKKIEIHNR